MDMKMDNLVNKLEVKFASKRVERVVKWIVGIALSSIFVALLSLVIIK
jgi:hypothetical protein